MSTDYGEKEREFIASLEADTGRDLAQWMAAISARGNVHRNDIIDWLRQHRFTFSKASWLERIHHNGGRPIYAEKPDLKALAAEAFDNTPPAPRPPREPSPPKPAASANPAVATATGPDGGTTDGLDALLAKGKAFRPLAQYLLKTVAAACPDASIAVRGALVSCLAPAEFAVIAISAKDVRLGLTLGSGEARDGFTPARIPGAGSHITHMLVLTDARQLNAALSLAIADARTRSGDSTA